MTSPTFTGIWVPLMESVMDFMMMAIRCCSITAPTCLRELYDAAAIDGASPLGVFWRISLPIIRPVLLVVVIFRTMDILNIVATVLAVTNGGPNFATETFTFHIYIEGFTYARFGYSAAASYILLIISAVISLVYIRRIGET